MAEEITVIADASPLIALAMVERLDLLHALFGSVKVVQAVYQEVMTGSFDPSERAIAQAFEHGWLERVEDESPVFQPMPKAAVATWMHLDPGESASISYAMRAPLSSKIIIDELAGRSVCQALGLAYTGTLGIIVMAKQQGIIPSAKAEFARLHAVGFWIAADLMRKMLARVGE
jgi:predicted nucleic acid-binding protein